MSATPSRDWRVWAAGVVALYLGLSVVGLARSPNWDEIWLLTNAAAPFSHQIDSIRLDPHPPLIFLLFRVWLAVFGHTEIVAKILVIGLNVSSLIIFAWLAPRLTRHWRLALVLFSGVYLQIGSVPNLTRGYGLLLSGATAAIALWTEWRNTGHRKWLVGWVVVMTITVYTHYYGLLLLATLVVVNLALGVRKRLFVAASAIPAVLIIPWIVYAHASYATEPGLLPPTLEWATERGLKSGLKDLPAALLAHIDTGHDPFGRPNPIEQLIRRRPLRIAAWGLHLGFLVLLVGRWRALLSPKGARQEEIRDFWALFTIGTAPVALLLGISVTIAPLFQPRFLVGLLPGYWLLLAMVVQITGRPARILAYFGVLPVVLAAAVVTSAQYLRPSEIRLRVREVAASFQEGDAIIGDSAIGAHVLWEWRAVLGRDEPVTTMRVGGPGHIPFRERRTHNVVPYHDLWTLDTGGKRRVWYFCSSRKECDKAVEFFGGRGFRLSDRRYGDAFAEGARLDLKEFVSERDGPQTSGLDLSGRPQGGSARESAAGR